MKLRTRLVLAFLYILIVVIVALAVPLGATLARRAKADLEAETLQNAQTIAAYIGPAQMSNTGALDALLDEAVPPEIARTIVVDASGVVIYDSIGGALGDDFASPQRPEIQATLRGDPYAEDRFSQTESAEIMVAAAPIIDGQVIGALRLTRDYAEVDAAVKRTVGGIALIGGAGIVAGVLIAFALAGSLARPIQRLAEAARRLGRGDLGTRVGDVGGAEEVMELSTSFDDMADRLEGTVTAQREFVANASHQLRTPLAGMKLRLEAAQDADSQPEDLRRQLVAAEKEVDRLSEIVDRLLVMANRIEAGAATTIDLTEAARAALERWATRAERRDATLELDGAGHVPATAEAGDVDQILDNLIDNAITYAPGMIRVETATNDGEGVLRVIDHGDGIPAQDLGSVTQRFYRGSGTTPGGSGLGLAIARELAERWDGRLVVASGDAGTTVEVAFPAGAQPTAEA